MNERDINLLMQRAHLYESMEKYKQGVADLKLVLKIDPQHRMAILELVRLTDLAGLRKAPSALRSFPLTIEMIHDMRCLLTLESKILCVKLTFSFRGRFCIHDSSLYSEQLMSYLCTRHFMLCTHCWATTTLLVNESSLKSCFPLAAMWEKMIGGA